MGLFDRLIGKSTPRPTPPPATPPPTVAASISSDSGPAEAAPAGNLVPQLAAARAKLEARDLDGARAIYEEVLAAAGDRPDVLVTISGDLGSCGYLQPIVELIAPRYDAERHGPATGLNLLQAYLALRNPEAAQHVLDILFALRRPDLEERLWGFSNAIAELIEARKHGRGGGPTLQINLVTISKPIWSYGIETLPDFLPAKTGPVRRVAFAHLATPGRTAAGTTVVADAVPVDDALARFSRGLPLWLAETMYFSAQYDTVAAIGMMGQSHFASFPAEWTTDHIRQLIDTGGRFDYVLTGAVQEQSGDFALVLRLWEIKSFRERKTFETRWTPATADAALTRLHEQLRTFFEWKVAPGFTYSPPPHPTAWIEGLTSSLSYFLADKGVLPKERALADSVQLPDTATSEAAALAHLTLAARAQRLGQPIARVPDLVDTPLVRQARSALS